MVNIATPEDIIQALLSDQELLRQVRQAIMTEDVLALPAQFAESLKTQNRILDELAEQRESQDALLETQNRLLAEQAQQRETQDALLETQNRLLAEQAEQRESQDALLETQNRLLAEQAQQRETQDALLETQNRLLAEQAEQRETQNELLREVRNHGIRLQRMDHDFRNFRGNFAERAARKSAYGIAIVLSEEKSLDLDITSVRTIPRGEYTALARQYGRAKFNALPRDVKLSFLHSDLIIEAREEDGPIFYIAVEASYTCDGRDTARAISHSLLLTQFTGKESYPAISGVRFDSTVQPIIESGDVLWHPIEEEEMDPGESS